MSASSNTPRVVFVYWGRRGAVSRLALELARHCTRSLPIEATWSIARQNELFPSFAQLDLRLLPVTTFDSAAGALFGSWRALIARRAFARLLDRFRPVAVVNLMPHVWSPLLVSVARRMHVRYVTVVHDADPHPGEPTGAMHNWLAREVAAADVVITLTRVVAERLTHTREVSPHRVHTLFLPDLSYAPLPESTRTRHAAHAPFRLLFFGRVIAYKGVSKVVDAVEILRQRGVPVTLGLYGEGDLGHVRRRLAALDADVVNRWIPEEEVGAVLARHDAVVLSHTEASQSGLVAAAFGAGLPVVTVPVGGLAEQVEDGVTGVVARGVEPADLADAIERIVLDTALYGRLCAGIAATRSRRSIERFLLDLLTVANAMPTLPAAPVHA